MLCSANENGRKYIGLMYDLIINFWVEFDTLSTEIVTRVRDDLLIYPWMSIRYNLHTKDIYPFILFIKPLFALSMVTYAARMSPSWFHKV